MTDEPCRCGSGLSYQQCCAPFHLGLALPPTAEALMRSRFTAYCLQNPGYLLATWDAGTRPIRLDFADDRQQWHKLDIIRSKQGEANDFKGTVEFKAFFSDDNGEWVLHERSRFVKNDGCWFYVDGITRIAVSNGQIGTSKNAACPCGSGKKFKRCCGATDARK